MIDSQQSQIVVGRLPSWSLSPETRAQWRALCGDNPFRRLEWLESWWRAYGQGAGSVGRRRELFALAVLVRGRIVGVAPWYREYTAAAGHSIRMLGGGEVCSEYVGLMAAPGYEAAVGNALAITLTERRVADRELGTDNIPWDFLELKSAQADDPALQALLSHLGDRGCAVHSREGTPCWRLDLPETWEQYLGRLSHSHRKQLRRIERRYFDTGLAVLRSAVDEASLDRGLDVLIDLHQKRWRSREQPGCFADKRFAAFMVDAARAQLAAGDLRLHWLELAGTPIAAEYHLASGRAVYAYQSGIEPAALEFEPGRMITVALVRQAIAEGRQTYDFLRGNERYKAHFRAAPVQVANIRVAPPTATGRLRDTLWLAGDNLRNVIKAGLGQSPVSEAPHPV